jgi:hypothetical protein
MDVASVGPSVSSSNRDQIIVVNLFARGSVVLVVRFQKHTVLLFIAGCHARSCNMPLHTGL